MKTFFLHVIVSWLTGLSKTDFKQVSEWVIEAANRFFTSADKAKFVNDQIKLAWPKLAGWAVNLLRELAVGLFKKKAV